MLKKNKCFGASLAAMTLLASAILLAGCKGNAEEKKTKAKPDRGGRQSNPGAGEKCLSIEALEILEDGKTVVSRLTENTWLAWDLDDKKVKAKDLSLNYFEASSDGTYLLSKVSYRKYRLMQLKNRRYIRKALISISSRDNPSMEFTRDSQYILIRHRPYGSALDQFDLYDIENGDIKKTFRAAGIKFIKVDKGAKNLIMGYDNGFDRFIAKYDLETLNEIFRVDLPRFRPFSYMQVAAGRIIAKSKRDYFVYSLSNGELLYQADYRHIYDVEAEHGLALVAKSWGEVAVVDLSDGREVFAGTSPKKVILSTCRLRGDPLRIACKERDEQNKIFVWGMESGENVLSCY